MPHNINQIKESIIIARPPKEVFSCWRKFENLPLSMEHLKEVEKIGNSVYHWKTKAPLGTSVEWDAIITDEIENKYIRWQSINDSDIQNSGTVRFVEWHGISNNSVSTYLEVELNYKPPFGKIGEWIAFIFGENPKQQIKDDLLKFKFILEKKNRLFV